MVQIAVHDIEGQVVDQIELSDAIFGVSVSEAVVHQAVLRQLADSRQGTASSKTRSEVAGGGKKMFRQKGTGFARRGSRRAPPLRGGGAVFGPRPRSYNQAMPKKMRRLALRCCLSGKVADEELIVVDQLALEQPKTKEIVRVLANLGVGASALIVTAEPDANVYKSARNIPGTKTIPANLLNVVDVLSHRKVVITLTAVKVVEGLWSPKERGGTPVAA